MMTVILGFSLFILTLLGLVGILMIRFQRGKKKAALEWESLSKNILDFGGATRHLEIVPLIDLNTKDKVLKGEPGVSYLIKTDQSTILFDLGYNMNKEDPSPLMHNMKQLGVSVDDIDSIVISHNHPDHVGGMKWKSKKTFSFANDQIDLGNKKVYTPIPMTYPGLEPVCTCEPTVISPGIAITGTIANPLFFLGWTPEQALAINVKDKGIVIIVGCGHQTVYKLIKRVRVLFKEPIYGIIGGLHCPVTDAPLKILGIPVQKFVGTGKLPWRPITMEEVRENIKIIKTDDPKIVALSPHDSCEASIREFQSSFPNVNRDIKVGETITV